MMVLMYVDRRAPRAGGYAVIHSILVSSFNRPRNLKKGAKIKLSTPE